MAWDPVGAESRRRAESLTPLGSRGLGTPPAAADSRPAAASALGVPPDLPDPLARWALRPVSAQRTLFVVSRGLGVLGFDPGLHLNYERWTPRKNEGPENRLLASCYDMSLTGGLACLCQTRLRCVDTNTIHKLQVASRMYGAGVQARGDPK